MTEEQRDKQRTEQKKAIIDLLPKKGYHIGKVCKQVGISRGTFYKWKREDEEFDEQTDETFQYDVDDSEERLRLLRQGLPRLAEDGTFLGWIEKPHFGALVKHLEAKAKDRGYGRQIQIDDRRHENEPSMTDKEMFDEIKRLEGLYSDDDEEDYE